MSKPVFIRPTPEGFRIDGLLLPWGTTLAELDRQLTQAGSRRDGEYAETPRALCAQACGFAAISVEPAFGEIERPVRSLTYHLAPYDPGLAVADPAYWADAIRQQLGAPGEESIADEAEREGAGEGTVFYHATWKFENLEVGLSVFGGQRPESTGIAAAYLYLSWTDASAAASDYLPGLQAQQDLLDGLAVHPVQWTAWTLQPHQYRAQNGETAEERRTQRALSETPVFDTPAAWSCRLKDSQVAFWIAQGAAHAGLSTASDTVYFASGQDSVDVEWLNRLPGRFGGKMELRVAGLLMLDVHSSPSLTAIAQAVGKFLGRKIPCGESQDNG